VNRPCPGCGGEVSATAKFCRDCGTAVPAAPPVQQAPAAPTTTRTCGSCGGSLVSEARFCHLCGSETTTADSADAPTTVLAQEPAGTLTGQTAAPAVSSARLEPQDGESATIISREPDPPPASGLPAQPTCPSCHAAVSAGTRFCRACGAQLDGPSPAAVTPSRPPAPVCPNCQAQVESWASFCRHCGWSLSTPGASTTPSSATVAEGARCKVCGAPKTGSSELCSQCEQAMGT
jgi:predicted amidophosphoribosyltransferase